MIIAVYFSLVALAIFGIEWGARRIERKALEDAERSFRRRA